MSKLCQYCDGTKQICDTKRGCGFDLLIDKDDLEIYVNNDNYGHECDFDSSVEIKYCPMCGRSLKESE